MWLEAESSASGGWKMSAVNDSETGRLRRRSDSDEGEGVPAPPPVQPIRTQLAEKISGKQKSISGYETGATLPSIRTLIKVAKVLKKPASHFLDE